MWLAFSPLPFSLYTSDSQITSRNHDVTFPALPHRRLYLVLRANSPPLPAEHCCGPLRLLVLEAENRSTTDAAAVCRKVRWRMGEIGIRWGGREGGTALVRGWGVCVGEWEEERESFGGGDYCRCCDGGYGSRKQSTVQARVGSSEELSVLPCSACDRRVLHFAQCVFLFLLNWLIRCLDFNLVKYLVYDSVLIHSYLFLSVCWICICC